MIAFQESAAASTQAAAAEKSIVARMADKMRTMAMNGTAVTADSLHENSDFTRAEIKQHGPEAADLARQLAVRQVS